MALVWPSVPAPTFPLCKGWSSLPELTALVLAGALKLYHKLLCWFVSVIPRSPGPPGQPCVLQYPVGECPLEMGTENASHAPSHAVKVALLDLRFLPLQSSPQITPSSSNCESPQYSENQCLQGEVSMTSLCLTTGSFLVVFH